MEIFPIDVMEIIPITVMGSIGYGNYWLNPAILPIELTEKTLHMLKSNDFEWFNTTYGNIPHRSYGNISHKRYGISFHKAYGKTGPYTKK